MLGKKIMVTSGMTSCSSIQKEEFAVTMREGDTTKTKSNKSAPHSLSGKIVGDIATKYKCDKF